MQLLAELFLVNHGLRENVGGSHEHQPDPWDLQVGSALLCLSLGGAWIEQRGKPGFKRKGVAFLGQILFLPVLSVAGRDSACLAELVLAAGCV